jgi:hypothetical protein
MYALFAFRRYYPGGGWNDFKGSFQTKEEAIDRGNIFLINESFEFFQVIDLTTLEKIYNKHSYRT